MTREVTALLVFCEGKHEVAFMHRLLRKCLGFGDVRTSFSEYPSPFNQIFKENVERHMRSDHKPGASLNVIIDQADLLEQTTLLANTRVSSFARFLAGFIGIEFPK